MRCWADRVSVKEAEGPEAQGFSRSDSLGLASGGRGGDRADSGGRLPSNGCFPRHPESRVERESLVLVRGARVPF